MQIIYGNKVDVYDEGQDVKMNEEDMHDENGKNDLYIKKILKYTNLATPFKHMRER